MLLKLWSVLCSANMADDFDGRNEFGGKGFYDNFGDAPR